MGTGGAKIRAALCVLLTTLIVGAGLGLSPAPAAAVTDPQEKADEWQTWCLINAERRSRGIPPVLMSSGLQTMARQWSEAQANRGYYGHRSNVGSATTAAIGYWDLASENVGYYNPAYSDVEGLHGAYMNSSSHRSNILDRRFEYVGIGNTIVPGRVYNTQNFASRPALSTTSALPLGQRFIDVCSDNSYFQDIKWMYDEGITTGYAMKLANGHSYRDFRPAGTVTRSTLAAFLQRVVGASGAGGPCGVPFLDVSPSDPFRTQICWMKNMGLTGDATTFLPGAAANRQAMASWMYQLWDQQEGNDFTPPANPTFTDVPVDHPYFAAIEWMADSGISRGNSDGTWKPTGEVKRQVMARFFHLYAPLV